METLFHYCSNDAFVSMILQKQIWFSMFSASNDFLEGRVAIQVFEDLCLKDGVLAPHVSELKKAVEHMLEIAPAAGFCLSEAPDQVSQWRGYAREGRGFSVGFDARMRELSDPSV